MTADILAKARAIIFDCDGTLVDSPPLYARAWVAGFRAAGADMAPAWYLARAGLSEHVLLEAFERETGVTLDHGKVTAAMRAAFLAELRSVREIESVTAIARQNFRRVPMAVASGAPGAIVHPTLDATGLRPLFDAVVTIEDVTNAKPAPDLFLEAARRMKALPQTCVVFEDSREGLEAARRAGMVAIDVATLVPAASSVMFQC
jgi:beta-phosphoglucomutase-like phosphatase (HAD superfamily)